MNSISINGCPQLQCGEVGDYAVMSSHLGHHQQCYHMAMAACKALGLDYEQTSPSDIEDSIKMMQDWIELFNAAEYLDQLEPMYSVDHMPVPDAVVAGAKLARHYMATVKNDDDELLTPEWLSQVGEINQYGAIFFGEYLHISEGWWSVGYCQLHDMMTPDTRGDLRALCRMVKHELQEVTS